MDYIFGKNKHEECEMRETYFIEVTDESVEIYGELTIKETFDFLSFLERKGYKSVILGTKNSTLHMLKRDQKEEIIDEKIKMRSVKCARDIPSRWTMNPLRFMVN